MSHDNEKEKIINRINELKKHYSDQCLKKSQSNNKNYESYGSINFNSLESKYITPEGDTAKYSSNSSEELSSVYYSGMC